jgi:hypothetical protein
MCDKIEITEITVKKYLQKIKKNGLIVDRKKRRLAELDAQRMNITAQMGGERVQTSPQHDRMAELTAQIVEIQDEIIADMAKYEVEKHHAINIIEQLETEDEYNLFSAVYIDNMLLKQAAAKYHINYENAKTIHGKALEYIRKHITAPKGYRFIKKPKR